MSKQLSKELVYGRWEPGADGSCLSSSSPARTSARPARQPRDAWLRAGFDPESHAGARDRLCPEAQALLNKGAIVRSLENLGERALPYKISIHNQRHHRGGYFLVDFYAPTTAVGSRMEYLSRDVDVIRPNIVKHPQTLEVKECEGIVPVPFTDKLYSRKK